MPRDRQSRRNMHKLIESVPLTDISELCRVWGLSTVDSQQLAYRTNVLIALDCKRRSQSNSRRLLRSIIGHAFTCSDS